MSKNSGYEKIAGMIVEKLTDEERLEIFSEYCKGCGRKQPEDHECYCERDE